jgi:hypothetical protein
MTRKGSSKDRQGIDNIRWGLTWVGDGDGDHSCRAENQARIRGRRKHEEKIVAGLLGTLYDGGQKQGKAWAWALVVFVAAENQDRHLF